MFTRINLNDTEWCNLVFEGRNKAYGAYEHRLHDNRRILLGLVLSILFFTGVAIIPMYKDYSIASPKLVSSIPTDFMSIDETKPVEKPIALPVYEPPRAVRPTIQFVAPQIVNDDVPEGKAMATHEEVLNPQISIGALTAPGELGGAIPSDVSVNVITGDDPIIREIVDQAPEYMGNLQEFLSKNLHYPEQARLNEIEGRVYIKFTVDENGTVRDAYVLRGIGAGCDEEALRVVKKMGRWHPAKWAGKIVPCYFTLPVSFVIANRY